MCPTTMDDAGERASTLPALRDARVNWLAARWPNVLPKFERTPDWLRRLAQQLELWVGEELDGALYLEAGFGPVTDQADEHPPEFLEWDAFNSDTLYLRAITDRFFIAVDVAKPAHQVAEAVAAVIITPRSRLEHLDAKDMTTRGPEPDSIRLMLGYADLARLFTVPHADDYGHVNQWRAGEDLRIFRALREDLWQPTGTAETVLINVA